MRGKEAEPGTTKGERKGHTVSTALPNASTEKKVPSYMDHIPLDPGSTEDAAITLASRSEESPSRPMPASWVRRREREGGSLGLAERRRAIWAGQAHVVYAHAGAGPCK